MSMSQASVDGPISGLVTPWKERPSWYVTNGSAVIGPVNTRLLLRGVAAGRVERNCFVARHSWSNWRCQNEIREIRSLRRWLYAQRTVQSIEPIKQALRAPRVDSSPLEEVSSSDQLLGQALQMAVRTTRASVGVLHQARPPFVGLVTSWAHGPGMGLNLGEVVPWHDDARVVAGKGPATIGTPESHVWARSSARRLTSRVHQRISGVALVPVRLGGTRGLLELGRFDHPFRASDTAALEDLGRSIELRFGQLG